MWALLCCKLDRRTLPVIAKRLYDGVNKDLLYKDREQQGMFSLQCMAGYEGPNGVDWEKVLGNLSKVPKPLFFDEQFIAMFNGLLVTDAFRNKIISFLGAGLAEDQTIMHYVSAHAPDVVQHAFDRTASDYNAAMDEKQTVVEIGAPMKIYMRPQGSHKYENGEEIADGIVTMVDGQQISVSFAGHTVPCNPLKNTKNWIDDMDSRWRPAVPDRLCGVYMQLA